MVSGYCISDCKLIETIRLKLCYTIKANVGLKSSLRSRIETPYNKYQSEADCNLLCRPKHF